MRAARLVIAALPVLSVLGLADSARAQPHPIDPQPAIHVLHCPGQGLASIVESLGDIDGDGAADFAVSAPMDSFVRVYSGRTGSSLYDYQGFIDQLGRGLGGGGDLDRDGVPDFVLGAPFGLPDARVDAYSGADGSPLWSAIGTGWGFGSCCDIVSDVDGDGSDDVVAGAPLEMVGTLFKVGRVRLLSGTDGSVLHTLTGQFQDERFGEAVAAAGDVDRDGAGDYLVGSWRHDKGKALLVSGRTGLTLHTWTGAGADCALGYSVAGVGDVNADGTPDFAIGDYCADTVDHLEGVARVYSGADLSVLLILRGEQPNEWFGQSVSGAGDYDGDGHDDVLGGALGIGTDIPYACVFSGLDGHVLFRFAYDIASETVTSDVCVRGGGDVDGNGTPDVLVGMPPAGYGTGAVYVFGRGAVAWRDLGGALASPHTALPKLTGEGVLAFGESIGVTLKDATPAAPLWVFAGTSQAFAPFLGGVLVPSPDVVLGPFATDAAGAWHAGFTWPVALNVGATWTLQAWIASGSAPAGFAASNAIAGDVQ